MADEHVLEETSSPNLQLEYPEIESDTATEDQLGMAREIGANLAANIKKVIVGKDDVVKVVVAALFSRGHVLIEGVPGYPTWVTDRYLQLTDDFPESVKTLAAELVRGQDNPYDMAEAIRQHLLTLPYSLQVTHPPPGQDWVEHFLFVQRKGYCQNYASPMITMLRSLGVPARLAVGFAPGIRDGGRGVWEVRALHYHAWPEVYLPQYGWVEFEPTPPAVQPALAHLGIESTATVFNPFLDPEFCIEDFDFGNCDTTEIETSIGEDELVELTPDNSQNAIEAPSAGGAGWTFSQIPHLDKRKTSLAPATKRAKMFLAQEKRSPTRCSYYEARLTGVPVRAGEELDRYDGDVRPDDVPGVDASSGFEVVGRAPRETAGERSGLDGQPDDHLADAAELGRRRVGVRP